MDNISLVAFTEGQKYNGREVKEQSKKNIMTFIEAKESWMLSLCHCRT